MTRRSQPRGSSRSSPRDLAFSAKRIPHSRARRIPRSQPLTRRSQPRGYRVRTQGTPQSREGEVAALRQGIPRSQPGGSSIDSTFSALRMLGTRSRCSSPRVLGIRRRQTCHAHTCASSGACRGAPVPAQFREALPRSVSELCGRRGSAFQGSGAPNPRRLQYVIGVGRGKWRPRFVASRQTERPCREQGYTGRWWEQALAQDFRSRIRK